MKIDELDKDHLNSLHQYIIDFYINNRLFTAQRLLVHNFSLFTNTILNIFAFLLLLFAHVSLKYKLISSK